MPIRIVRLRRAPRRAATIVMLFTLVTASLIFLVPAASATTLDSGGSTADTATSPEQHVSVAGDHMICDASAADSVVASGGESSHPDHPEYPEYPEYPDEPDCPVPPAQPDAHASLVCPADHAVVVLANTAAPGAASVSFTVSAPAGVSPAFTTTTGAVGPGSEIDVSVPVAEGETRSITVIGVGDVEADAVSVAGGDHPSNPPHHDFEKTFTVTGNCDAPAASVTAACATSGLAVSVTNVGTDTGTFAIGTTTAELSPGETLVVNVPVAEGASVQVTVTLGGEPVAGSPFTFTRDCEHPAAGSVTAASATSGLAVSVTNVGTDTGTFAIGTTTAVLSPGETLVVNVPVAEGASVQVTVTLGGEPVTGSPFTFTRDCEHPAASVSANCIASGAQLVLSNSGAEPTELTVYRSGVAIGTVPVGAGATVMQVVPMAEDASAVFRVTGPGGFDSGDLPVTLDCIQLSPGFVVTTPSVAGVTATRLAFTGSGSAALALPGALMVGVGSMALLASRRRRIR